MFGLDLGRLIVRIEANTARFETNMGTAERTLDRFAKKATTLGTKLSLILTAPLAAVGTKAVQVFASFDREMTNALSIMEAKDRKFRKQMEETARELSTRSVHSAQELARAYYYLASAGMDAAQSMQALPIVSRLAVAGAFDLEKATELLSDAQTSLGLRMKDPMANMREMTRLSNLMSEAANRSMASIEQFAISLTHKAGPAARSLNKETEEIIALLSVFADQGIKAEIAGERTDILFRDLAASQRRASEAWEALGISSFDAAGDMLHVWDIIRQLDGALGGLSDKQKLATLHTLGFQDRSVAVLKTLLGTGDALQFYYEHLKATGETTQTVADYQMRSFENQLKLTSNQISLAGQELGKELIPHLLWLADAVKSVTDWYRKLAPSQRALILDIGLFVAAAGPAVLILGKMGTVAVAAGKGFKGLYTAIMGIPFALEKLKATWIAIENLSLFRGMGGSIADWTSGRGGRGATAVAAGSGAMSIQQQMSQTSMFDNLRRLFGLQTSAQKMEQQHASLRSIMGAGGGAVGAYGPFLPAGGFQRQLGFTGEGMAQKTFPGGQRTFDFGQDALVEQVRTFDRMSDAAQEASKSVAHLGWRFRDDGTLIDKAGKMISSTRFEMAKLGEEGRRVLKVIEQQGWTFNEHGKVIDQATKRFVKLTEVQSLMEKADATRALRKGAFSPLPLGRDVYGPHPLPEGIQQKDISSMFPGAVPSHLQGGKELFDRDGNRIGQKALDDANFRQQQQRALSSAAVQRTMLFHGDLDTPAEQLARTAPKTQGTFDFDFDGEMSHREKMNQWANKGARPIDSTDIMFSNMGDTTRKISKVPEEFTKASRASRAWTATTNAAKRAGDGLTKTMGSLGKTLSSKKALTASVSNGFRSMASGAGNLMTTVAGSVGKLDLMGKSSRAAGGAMNLLKAGTGFAAAGFKSLAAAAAPSIFIAVAGGIAFAAFKLTQMATGASETRKQLELLRKESDKLEGVRQTHLDKDHANVLKTAENIDDPNQKARFLRDQLELAKRNLGGTDEKGNPTGGVRSQHRRAEKDFDQQNIWWKRWFGNDMLANAQQNLDQSTESLAAQEKRVQDLQAAYDSVASSIKESTKASAEAKRQAEKDHALSGMLAAQGAIKDVRREMELLTAPDHMRALVEMQHAMNDLKEGGAEDHWIQKFREETEKLISASNLKDAEDMLKGLNDQIRQMQNPDIPSDAFQMKDQIDEMIKRGLPDDKINELKQKLRFKIELTNKTELKSDLDNMMKSVQTPQEKLKEQFKKIQELVQNGMLGGDNLKRVHDKAIEDFEGNLKKEKDAKGRDAPEMKFSGAFERGSVEAVSAVNNAIAQRETAMEKVAQKAAEQKAAQDQANLILEEIRDDAKKNPPVKVFAGW